jgi:hypothetical protein
VIEVQLAHTVRDSPDRAYNRTEFVEQRRKMMRPGGLPGQAAARCAGPMHGPDFHSTNHRSKG